MHAVAHSTGIGCLNHSLPIYVCVAAADVCVCVFLCEEGWQQLCNNKYNLVVRLQWSEADKIIKTICYTYFAIMKIMWEKLLFNVPWTHVKPIHPFPSLSPPPWNDGCRVHVDQCWPNLTSIFYGYYSKPIFMLNRPISSSRTLLFVSKIWNDFFLCQIVQRPKKFVKKNDRDKSSESTEIPIALFHLDYYPSYVLFVLSATQNGPYTLWFEQINHEWYWKMACSNNSDLCWMHRFVWNHNKQITFCSHFNKICSSHAHNELLLIKCCISKIAASIR